jgi:hypothetical protein
MGEVAVANYTQYLNFCITDALKEKRGIVAMATTRTLHPSMVSTVGGLGIVMFPGFRLEVVRMNGVKLLHPLPAMESIVEVWVWWPWPQHSLHYGFHGEKSGWRSPTPFTRTTSSPNPGTVT